ncbi:MAG: RNA 2',3'-cyclic phosphodiesterase [Arenimonas sp.]
MHRLFFALEPDGHARAEIALLTRPWHDIHGSEGWIAPGRYHVTLAFLGHAPTFDEDVAARAADAAAGIDAQGFAVRLERLGSFPGTHAPWFLAPGPAPALHALATALGERLVAGGVHFDARPFVPHLTVRRVRGSAPVVEIAPIESQAREFLLLHGEDGVPAYQTLGRWPLRAL